MQESIRVKIIAIGLLFAFLVNSIVVGPIYAQEIVLPSPGALVSLSPEYNFPILKGLKVHPENPFKFDFIMDVGADSIRPNTGSVTNRPNQRVINNRPYSKEAKRLIKYFLASLTIPEADLWVNLSPYEKNRIIPQSFGLTEMGRDLLAEDYMLKQITASLIYPEAETGKKFWKRIYAEAAKKFGTTIIPVNTFNKVWIIPEKAVVYENLKAATAYVVEARLKVMMEEDYLSLNKHNRRGGDHPPVTTEIIRQIVIPELTREVNEGSNFAQLRQVYNSLILATWYKKKIKDSILAKVYEGKNKIKGTEYQHSIIVGTQFIAPESNNDIEAIYHRYLQAFKRGAYNYVKEEQNPLTKEIVPRKYFSGGVDATHLDSAMVLAVIPSLPQILGGHAILLNVDLQGIFPRANQAMLSGASGFIGGVFVPNPKMSERQRAKLIVQELKKIYSLEFVPKEDISPKYKHFEIRLSHLAKFLSPDDEDRKYLQDTGLVREKPGGFIIQNPFDDGNYVRVLIIQNPEILEDLFALLKGDEVVSDYSYIGPSSKNDDSFWDTWSESQWGKDQYIDHVHPIAVEAALALIVERISQGHEGPINVVDIFGGDGLFLALLHQKVQEFYKDRLIPKIQYWLIDGNYHNINAAHKNLRGIKDVQIIKADLTKFNLRDVLPVKADIVTSIGGGFNAKVVENKSDAVKLSDDVYQALAQDGKLLVTGISAILMTPQEFQEHGFWPLNYAVPLKFLNGSPKQMFIFSKNKSPWDYQFKNGTAVPNQMMDDPGKRVEEIAVLLNRIFYRSSIDGGSFTKLHRYRRGIIKLSHLKEIAFTVEDKDLMQDMSIELGIGPKGQPFWVISKSGKNYKVERISDLQSLLMLLKGDEFEGEYKYIADKSVHIELWDDWHNLPEQKIPYLNEIHPMSVEAVLSMIEEKISQGHQGTIKLVDIYGGDGSFIAVLNQRIKEIYQGRVLPQLEIWLLEGNSNNIKKARERLTDMEGLKLHIIQADLNSRKLGDIIPFKADIITSIGGGFNFKVSTRGGAMNLVGSVREVLADDGKLLVTGMTPILVSPQQFREQGFTFLNLSIPARFLSDELPKEFFILGKSQANGGIDLSSGKAVLETKLVGGDGGVHFDIDPAMLKDLQGSLGFIPVIVDMRMLNNVRGFLEGDL